MCISGRTQANVVDQDTTQVTATCSDYQIRWLMKPERKNFLGKSLLDPSVLVVCVAPNRPSP